MERNRHPLRMIGAALGGGLLLAIGAMAQPFIVEGGKPCAEIVVAAQPARMARFAGRELQAYVEKISGAKLPIVADPGKDLPIKIYVGMSAHTDRLKLDTRGLAHGAFLMASGDNWLALLGPDKDFTPIEPWGRNYTNPERARVLKEWDAITGDTFGSSYQQVYARHSEALDVWDYDDRGTLNAVHEFLRSLGVRWYFPGELGEVVPQTPSILLPKVNKIVRPDFALRRYAFYNDHSSKTADEFLWQLRLGLNLGPELLGLSLPCHGSKFVHMRPETRQAHPEFYAILDGKRATDHKETGAPCLSSEGFFQKHLKYAGLMFSHYKEPMISIDVCDGYGRGLCECELCRGKGSPERGRRGSMSDYVWGYVNRVAQELYKTHPDRKVSGLSYSAYFPPPENIDRLSPNLCVIMCQTRSTFHNREAREAQASLRAAWLQKLPSKEIYIWDYYLDNLPDAPTGRLPVYFPRLIAQDLRALKGVSKGSLIEVYGHTNPAQYSWNPLAITHLNMYVTARLWWDTGQDVDMLLEDYYRGFYGPAAKEMKAYIEHAEANWPLMTSSVAPIDTSLRLLADAQRAAGDTIYGRRLAILADYVQPMQQLRERLAKGRENVPAARALPRKKADLKLDGLLDDKFWEGVRTYNLYETVTGKPPRQHTSFKIAWGDDEALYLGIQCMDRDMKGVRIGASRSGDRRVLQGDYVEVFIETQTHSYYQIVVNPVGATLDQDRKEGANARWVSGAQAAAHADSRSWSVELRLPAAGENARDSGIAGRKPTETYPWFINVCRQRVRGSERERSAWSPTGESRTEEPVKFGKVYAR